MMCTQVYAPQGLSTARRSAGCDQCALGLFIASAPAHTRVVQSSCHEHTLRASLEACEMCFHVGYFGKWSGFCWQFVLFFFLFCGLAARLYPCCDIFVESSICHRCICSFFFLYTRLVHNAPGVCVFVNVTRHRVALVFHDRARHQFYCKLHF